MSTITNLETNSTGADSKDIINNNFDNLNADKLEKSGGTMTGQLEFSGTAHAGVKLLSLTTAQRDALTPANGMIIYNSTTAQVEFYQGGAWQTTTGAADASVTAKGVVEIATQAEIDAGTETGGTNAVLAISPDKLNTSIYKTQLPSSDQKAALAGTAGTPSGTNKYVTNDDVAATGASKVIRSKSNSTIDDSLLALTTQGDTVYSDGTDLKRLAKGTANQVYRMNSGATAPEWATPLYSKKILVNATPGSISNSNVETTLLTTTLTGGLLGTNNCVKFKIYISDLNSNGSAVNHIFKLKYGSTTVADFTKSGTTSAAANNFNGVIEGCLLASGATNTQKGVIRVFGIGQYISSSATIGEAVNGIASGTAAEDSTTDKTLSITAQINGANSDLTTIVGYVELITAE